MYHLKRVQAGIDYIEAHLGLDLALADAARAAGMSLWHFQRVFKALTNETVKTYIRSRRFAKALDQLLNGNASILSVALDAGYDTQESFARAFKSCFGMPPSQYRRNGNRLQFTRKIEFNADYLRHLQHGVSLQPDCRTRPAMRLVGLSSHFYGTASEKNNLGRKLPPLWASFMSRIGEIAQRVPGRCYGVIEQLDPTSEALRYTAAIEVESFDRPLPAGMVSLELPEQHCACFDHRGLPAALDNTVNYIYSSWLLNSGRERGEGADLEIYGEQYRPDSELSLILYALPLAEAAAPP